MMTRAISHRFTVRGGGVFPLDMLRYDGCYPASGDDVARMSRREVSVRDVELGAITVLPWVPTQGRWNSFGWAVIAHRAQNVGR